MVLRPRALVLVVALVAAAAVAAVLVWQIGGGDDERAKVAGLPGVREATDVDGGLRVSFKAGAKASQIIGVLAQLDGESEATLSDGRASLEVGMEGLTPDDELARLLLAAGGVDARGGTIELEEGSDDVSVRAAPADPLDAPIVARSLVLALAEDGRWPESVELLTVASPGTPVGEEPVAVVHPVAAAAKLAALFGAAAEVRRRGPRVVIDAGHVELRVTATGEGDAGEAWDELASRVLPIGGLGEAETYVDVPGEGPDGTRPLISGRLAEDPGPAFALLDRLNPLSSRAFATTDLDYVEGEVAGPAAIGPFAAAVGSSAGSRPAARLKLEWRGGIQADGGEVEDSPAGVALLGPGIADAAEAGLGVAWSHRPGESAPAALGLRVPARLQAPAIGSLIGHPDKLRGLAEAIRTIAWPGTARFELSLGNGTCEDLTTVAAMVAVVSTSDGPARVVRQGNTCSSDAAVAAVRRAWSATATGGASGS